MKVKIITLFNIHHLGESMALILFSFLLSVEWKNQTTTICCVGYHLCLCDFFMHQLFYETYNCGLDIQILVNCYHSDTTISLASDCRPCFWYSIEPPTPNMKLPKL